MIVFCDPPAPTPRRRAQHLPWQEILDLLRQNPGRWALLPGTHSNSTVGHITSGWVAGASRGEFEATGRIAEDGRYRIWVRLTPSQGTDYIEAREEDE